MITTEVENFPGYPDGVEPFQMMDDMRRQAERFGTEFVSGMVTKVDFSCSPKKVWVEDSQLYEADTVIIATGASAKFLGIQSEEDYKGRGVSACATCDGFFYRKKTVAVVGGGDTACEEANYLSGLCEKVYMIVRKPYLRASDIMQQRVLNNPKIEVLFNTNTVGLFGENGVEGAKLVYKKGTPEEKIHDIAIDGFFLAIGHKPNSDIFKPWVATDEVGYIITEGATPKTCVPGVFAAGDVADPHYRQAITAAASGCKAAIEAKKFLEEQA
jgi:thioredoxin reductase (NADPH)